MAPRVPRKKDNLPSQKNTVTSIQMKIQRVQ